LFARCNHFVTAGASGSPLRVTDVEQQPFRGMGFVSAIMVSGLFLLGLPLVLLWEDLLAVR
jgi:hypothetical protein